MLDPAHLKVMKKLRFDREGTVREALKRDQLDGVRVIYAITDPGETKVVYVGETEAGKNLRGRLRAHLNDRSKINLVEPDSILFVHIQVTEFIVLSAFEEWTGGLPSLNKKKVNK
jgi:hypothetical protein